MRKASVAALLILIAPLAWSQTAAERERHVEMLLARFPELRLVRQDEMDPKTVEAFAEGPYPVKVEPGPIYGNFNGDRHSDFAVLLAFRKNDREAGHTSSPDPEAHGGLVAMCLSKGAEDFDCHFLRHFSIWSGKGRDEFGRAKGANMVLYKEPPTKELVFRFLGRPRIEPPEYRNVGEGELDWNGKYRRALGAKNVGKTYGRWSPDNPETSDLGFVRQPYETLVTRELYGYSFRYFWKPQLGILSCCGED